jgi:hypothetical protein
MKRLIFFLSLIAIFTCTSNAQLITRHLFGSITPSDVSAANSLKSTDKANLTLSYFLRAKITENAFEIPLFKGTGGQWNSSTGMGVSVMAYDKNAIKKFSINGILFADNKTAQFSSIALTAGVPIPFTNFQLPEIDAGFRYDWQVKTVFLQLNVSLEF